jgi:hypothetical protein
VIRVTLQYLHMIMVLCEDELLAYPYKEPDTDIKNISDDVEFCNAHLPEYDSDPQSAAQALLSKSPKIGGKQGLLSFSIVKKRKLG